MSGAKGDFLDEMGAASWARVPEAVGVRRPAPSLRLSGAFDLIAEVKLTAPSVGRLALPAGDRAAFVASRAQAYAAGGAAAISVLTEPTRFDGALADVAAAAAAVDVPVMRKDFLVDPIQVAEAGAAGAGGVLLIARMLDDAALDACLDTAAAHGLFVLLEAFDQEDLQRAGARVDRWAPDAPPLLVGVNTRDLSTLQVDPDRLAALASSLPIGAPGVAESGLVSPEDAARVRRQGYALGLVGSALMRSDNPEGLVRALVAAGRGS